MTKKSMQKLNFKIKKTVTPLQHPAIFRLPNTLNNHLVSICYIMNYHKINLQGSIGRNKTFT